MLIYSCKHTDLQNLGITAINPCDMRRGIYNLVPPSQSNLLVFQSIAACCGLLQYLAGCCCMCALILLKNVAVAVCRIGLIMSCFLHNPTCAVCCNILQCVEPAAVYCNVVQCETQGSQSGAPFTLQRTQ